MLSYGVMCNYLYRHYYFAIIILYMCLLQYTMHSEHLLIAHIILLFSTNSKSLQKSERLSRILFAMADPSHPHLHFHCLQCVHLLHHSEATKEWRCVSWKQIVQYIIILGKVFYLELFHGCFFVCKCSMFQAHLLLSLYS